MKYLAHLKGYNMLTWEDLVGHVKVAVESNRNAAEKGEHGAYTPEDLISKDKQELIKTMSVDDLEQFRAEIETIAEALVAAGVSLKKKSDELTTSQIVNAIGLKEKSNVRKMVNISADLISDAADMVKYVLGSNIMSKVTFAAKNVKTYLKTEEERTKTEIKTDYAKVVQMASETYPLLAEAMEKMIKECSKTITTIDESLPTITDTVRFYQNQEQVDLDVKDKISGLKDIIGNAWDAIKGLWSKLTSSITDMFTTTKEQSAVIEEAVADLENITNTI